MVRNMRDCNSISTDKPMLADLISEVHQKIITRSKNNQNDIAGG